ncbi:MAG: DinB family protein [Acidimicrobiia bacterium]
MPTPTLADLLLEYDRALAYTDSLVDGLTPEQIAWRPSEESSAIGWHLGHQAAVAHYMVRNLTAAEPRIDPAIDELMDSATPERDRGELPPLDRVLEYRSVVAERVRIRIGQIDAGEVGAPAQLRLVATNLLTAIVNHEYQHSTWIGELRADPFGLPAPPVPASPWLMVVEGYPIIATH